MVVCAFVRSLRESVIHMPLSLVSYSLSDKGKRREVPASEMG